MENNIDAMKSEIEFLSKKILELNKKLIESEKTKSRFLSLVASKLNNPITALLGIITHLKIAETKENRELYNLVCKEALNLDFKVQNIVAAAEIESGNVDITYALLNPKEITNEALQSLKYVLKEKNIEIKISDFTKQKLASDPKKVYTIIKNLISNACRYSHENSIIDIELSIRESLFIVEVKNRGEAPEVQYKPEVFTRFAKDASGNHGLGIGLSIVREICERLDGNIDYEIKDGFVTFVVKLPCNENMIDSEAYGSNEFLFSSFDDAVEL